MPKNAWKLLLDGNDRFIHDRPRHPRQDAERRHQVSSLQRPKVAIFGCADSRLSAEIIFDVGLGDAFVVRNAGQVISSSVVGSLEYAVAVLGVRLILVLGHDSCGAVRAAIGSLAADPPLLPPHIAALVARIAPAVRRVTGTVVSEPIDPESVDAQAVGREHLRDTVAELLDSSEVITAAIAEGSLAVVGANYHLADGDVVPDIVVGEIYSRDDS